MTKPGDCSWKPQPMALPGLLQGDEQCRDQNEAGNDTGGIDPAVQVSVVIGAARKTEHLQ